MRLRQIKIALTSFYEGFLAICILSISTSSVNSYEGDIYIKHGAGSCPNNLQCLEIENFMTNWTEFHLITVTTKLRGLWGEGGLMVFENLRSRVIQNARK